MPLPEAILNKPTLSMGLDLYYMAFWDLMADRLSSPNGAGMIKWSAINQYAISIGILDVDEQSRFKSIISHLDMEYLEHVRN